MRRKRLRIISLFLSMMIMLSTAIPIGSVFAADYDVKYHPDDWFGYTHSKEEIDGWIADAVGYPTVSDDTMAALKGEIRPGDVLSFQVEVEMPTGHEEIMEFLRDFSLNMTFPYGTNAMIEVYSSEAPLMTDEEYAERIADFNNSIDELEKELQDEEMLREIESDPEAKSIYRTYKDLVDNREKYYEIFLGQLETARTKYGSVTGKSSYGTAESWYGSCEDNPNTGLEEGETYESWKENFLESSYVEPQITNEEFAEIVADFDEQYPSLVEEYISMLEEAENDEEITDSDLDIIKAAIESIYDGTFYDTIIKYFEACRDGYYQFENDYANRLLSMFLSGWDLYNAYFGTYIFNFPDSFVQRNQQCTYIFDVNIIATDALSVGSYVSIPALRWFYEEDCAIQYWVSEGFLKGHWEDYYPCNSHRGSLLNLGNTTYANNIDFDVSDFEQKVSMDKRYMAWDYIINNFNDENYVNKFKYEYLGDVFSNNVLNAIRSFTIEYRDEFGNLIKSETKETNDAYFNVVPEEVYDYQLVSPEGIKGVIQNEDITVSFNYEHKDAEITVSFVDTDGNELAPAQTISGKTLDEYRTTPLEIYGYKPIELPANASGILHEDSEDVEYIYALKDSSVTVNYLDDEGNPIAESETINGKVFNHYETSAKEIYGYRLTGTPVNAVGELTEEPITVTYFYTKKDAAVTINYLDESGTVLAESELLAGKYFTPYSAEPKKIYGYELTAIPGNASGTMQEDNTVINYIYRLKPSSVTVTHTDESGNVLSEEEIINGKVFDKYNTAAKDFYGYILLHSPKNASGELSETETTVSYIYRKIFDKLPDEPYRAETGDPLSDMELPFGWKFADPDTIFDSAGTHTIDVIVPADETHPEIRGTVTVKVTEKPVTEPPTVTEPDNQPSDPIENTPEEDFPNKPSEPIDKVPSPADKEEDHSGQEILTINPDTGYDEILLPILLPTVSAGFVLTILLCRILKRKSPKL